MKRGWALALATAGAVVLAGGGYVVGDRADDRSGPSCAEVRQTVETVFDDWKQLDANDMVAPVKARTAADLVLGNQDCYPFAAVSAVRAAVRQLDAAGESEPMMYAAGLVACGAVVKDRETCRDDGGE
ncbi:hypothetical protein [Streptomyces omiyaensis]|uniref:DUF732 domain-containing protein n=1 Tax=Streptomyces omiyaensis TaxID=68247 RepID=A0ABW7BQN6_9ACTN|nr:hypothetical protein [Streptomyces omiyaensis]GGY25639.1 hypothetical protein GCM10010363_02420 [Streptomyces omiyaensis]